jgi:hypothetical protein
MKYTAVGLIAILLLGGFCLLLSADTLFSTDAGTDSFKLQPSDSLNMQSFGSQNNAADTSESRKHYELLSFSTFPRYTLTELIEKNDVVVSGKILYALESRWSTPDGKQPEEIHVTERMDENGETIIDFAIDLKMNEFIYTDILFQVDTVHKGNLEEDEIIIRLPSGTVGELKSMADPGHNVEDYKEGDEVILFLKKYNDGNEDSNCYYLPTPQGAFIRQTDGETDVFVNFDKEELIL